MEIYTIGHSTHSEKNFLDILQSFKIQVLADVRSLPGSRYLPHFNQESMSVALKSIGINYVHMPGLGGRRRKICNDNLHLVAGWKHVAFRNYALYSLTSEFEKELNELISIAKKFRVVIMCAESVPWKCHRLLISNSLVAKGIKVLHILNKNDIITHALGKYGAKAEILECRVIYPD